MNYLENINNGFYLKDRKIINDNLNFYLVHNRNRIVFQKHPLGFKYLKLGHISDFEEFRLHFWLNTSNVQDKDLQIHDHSFDFESFILNGSITNNKYIIGEMDRMDGYIYDVKFRNEKSILILNTENCLIHLTESVKINCGEFYNMNSSEFHESINREDLTITLLKITKKSSKTARVFSPKKLESLTTFERSTLPFEENMKIIDKVIEITQTTNW